MTAQPFGGQLYYLVSEGGRFFRFLETGRADAVIAFRQALVIEMLGAEKGATLDALVEATGWLPHTTRAALTGLRKRGFSVERTREEGSASVYRIVAAPAVAAA